MSIKKKNINIKKILHLLLIAKILKNSHLKFFLLFLLNFILHVN